MAQREVPRHSREGAAAPSSRLEAVWCGISCIDWLVENLQKVIPGDLQALEMRAYDHNGMYVVHDTNPVALGANWTREVKKNIQFSPEDFGPITIVATDGTTDLVD